MEATKRNVDMLLFSQICQRLKLRHKMKRIQTWEEKFLWKIKLSGTGCTLTVQVSTVLGLLNYFVVVFTTEINNT